MKQSPFSFFSARQRHFRPPYFATLLILAILPGASVFCYWYWGERGLFGSAILSPLLIFALGLCRNLVPIANRWIARRMNAMDRLAKRLEKMLCRAARQGQDTLCLVAQLDDHAELNARLGARSAEQVMRSCVERIVNKLRQGDVLLRLDDAQCAVAIFVSDHLAHDSAIILGQRLQEAVSPVVILGDARIYPSVSLGFSSASQHQGCTGSGLALAAMTALADAMRHGPSAIRAFAPDQKQPPACPELLNRSIEAALEDEQFVPWFQPQISTDTGVISGVEALARWQHPVHGVLPPSAFLPAMEASGRIQVLGRAILAESLASVALWQKLDLPINHVGVNFSSAELRDPALLDAVQWQLDRYNLPPECLGVEILETVVAATPDDMIVRNIEALSKLGCLIDLDDFGTGHASISSIRRFAVQRLKIDRSFVTRADSDPEQQRMVSAILVMAEQLGLQTIGEGVETAGEHAILSQLGCTHVQGYGIARPMPGADIPTWCAKHTEKLAQPPMILHKSG